MAAEQLPPTEQQTIADLVRRIINGVQDIIDRQVELAKAEIKENLVQVGKASGLLIVGAVLLFLTAIFLLITIILVVEAIFPGRGWIAALVITLALGITGAILVLRGKDRVMISPVARTRQTLKEDLAWARRPLIRNGR
ncbi:MAG: phage holin family protein [Chloroflexota bacterium]